MVSRNNRDRASQADFHCHIYHFRAILDIMSNINELSIGQLKRAVILKEKITALEKELSSLVGTSVAGPTGRKGGMSAAGRARIAAAQKKRWAKIKANQPASAAPAKSAKRKMSAAGRAAISAAAKARWARVHAGK